MHKMSRSILYSFIISIISMSLIVILALGCANGNSGKAASVTFEQLLSNPSQYNGKDITIELVENIRPEMKFASAAELSHQIDKDVEHAQATLAKIGKY